MIVLVTSSNCGPCKALKEALEREGLTVDAEWDAYDDSLSLANYRIRNVPTLLHLDDTSHNEIKRIVGYNKLNEIKEFFADANN